MNDDIYTFLIALQISSYKTAKKLENADDKSILYKNAFGVLSDNVGIILSQLNLTDDQLSLMKTLSSTLDKKGKDIENDL